MRPIPDPVRDPRPVLSTDLDLPGRRAGKVRDIYTVPSAEGEPGSGRAGSASRLLVVATDRISAFDVVMPTPIPGKGRILTELAAFWLRFIERSGICGTHLLGTDPGLVPNRAFVGSTLREDLEGRSMIVRACSVIPVECVVRGYLEGSGWKEYQSTGMVCGVRLAAGLRQCDRLAEPIFTPATKEELGRHDENVTFARACELVGKPVMERLRDWSLAIYRAASEHAMQRGIIIADTKFEFGIPLDAPGGSSDPIVIDEALTPDSSRFWPAQTYRPGGPQASYDKQYVREYLEGLVARGQWDKSPPGPPLPGEVVAATLAKYRQALDILTADERTKSTA
ncbi:MAG: phosphoribosylaminoimidazolesuccinocarboxamide synthase [Phycisphaeraceae bacterium]|nr:phosphoribosylaminoimidazolesuccinocarboxamide synthase [Phycisphaerae bacterium]MBX3393226.1 phosphoribosylaminoimidazolesuccinocarboxamide synthase [Phycisphaeraceae bacterium]